MAKKRKRMSYELAPDLQERMEEIARTLGMSHLDLSRVKCIRSYGSGSRSTIARCHTIGKVMQLAMGIKAFYAIEFLERFDRLPKDEQDKVIIHELMHIPKSFGGGFRHHDYVCEKNVEVLYKKYVELKRQQKYFEM
ncbi:metallopeptidase [Candidatus Pacearchaeota archaeon]|nr:MAG: metallopeptidase [Candidatus Pacearchaeota archaeon]